MQPRRRFRLVLIKPSHYADDGYVIRWWRGMIPSNSLAAIHSLAEDCAARRVLGPDAEIEIESIDETNARVDVPAILARFRANGGFGLIGLVGVQTNQYPRALDIARPFRAAGVPVAIGGFHVRDACRCWTEARSTRRVPGNGSRHVCRRGRGTARRRAAGRGRGPARAGLRLHQGPAGDGRRAGAVPARSGTSRARSGHRQLRRRPWLPLPVFLLHDHQRPGPQVALSLARTMSSVWCASTGRRASTSSSSPTTISPATGTGRRSSIA